MPVKFTYPPGSKSLTRVSEKPKYGLRVAVVPFEDTRGDRNSMKTFWICFLPFAPYGFFVYERPETAGFFNTISGLDFDVGEDMAKAVVSSLRESGLFEKVAFVPEGRGDHADLIMQGEVRRTLYRGRTYTYCVSVAAAALWLVGLPVGDSKDVLDFTMVLRDRGTGKTIWQHTSQRSKRITQGFYYKWGDDTSGFAELTAEAMNEALGSLDKTMATYRR
jgi:hypothetical protein